MFDKEFYPSPPHLIEQMLAGVTIAGRTFLEPSAGKGDIVDYLYKEGAQKVIACELHPELRKIIITKADILAADFFSVRPEDVSHIHGIIMNPPFSNAEKHILHAWEIAPEGCEIVAICNSQTLENTQHNWKRRELSNTIKNYGFKQGIGEYFKNAERKTNVNVTLVRLYKPIKGRNFDFENFFFDMEEEQANENGIIRYDEVRATVGRFIEIMQDYDKYEELTTQMRNKLKGFKISDPFKCSMTYNLNISTRQEFFCEIQKHAWKHVFQVLNVERFLTKNIIENLNKMIEQQQKIPFTVSNIYKVIDLLILNRDSIMNDALVDAVDLFTKHYHENRYFVEGWKTNSGYMINEKIIVPNMFTVDRDGRLKARWYQGNIDMLTDLCKVLCALTGTDYSTTTSLQTYTDNTEVYPNKWYSWDFFEFKGFMKGTIHLRFKDRKVWEMLNVTYAKIKGQVLPDKM